MNMQTNTAAERWWRIADFGVFGAWMTLVWVIVTHHEPWADEAQAWLIARDLDLRTIWFHELRYEGSPGAWHTLLWMAQHWLHVPYASFGVIGMLCAATGVAFVLWKAPFPRPLRYLLVFSYVMVYQYAVVARSYNMMALPIFAAAYFFHDLRRPWRITLALILLASISVHGIFLALAFGFCYLFQAFRAWPGMEQSLRWQYLLCIAAMGAVLLFFFMVLKSTPDMLMYFPDKIPTGAKQPINLKRYGDAIGYAFFDQPIVSAIFLLLSAAWCYTRKQLLLFLLCVVPVVALFVKIAGRPHHHGILFLAVIACLWIAWPTAEERTQLAPHARMALTGMTAMLACLFALNTYDAAAAMRNDYRYPYSGAADAALYLHDAVAEHATIFGYAYGTSALQAYFDHDILKNIHTSYTHYGTPFEGFQVDLDEIVLAMPDYVVFFSNAPRGDFNTVDPPMTQLGYRLVHVSPGDIFYKRTAFDSATYLIYRREALLR